MKQIYLLGSSSVYGVGSTEGGWAGLLKQHMHQRMYSVGGVGERYEVYNFGKSGATIDFVSGSLPSLLDMYGRDCPRMAIVNVGGNNSKAVTDPDNFVSTPDEYEKELKELLGELINQFEQVIFVQSGPVDESKTTPKKNPLDGGKTYHTTERKELFNGITKRVCNEQGVSYIDIPERLKKEWVEKYCYKDGLHSNNEGYAQLFELLVPHVDKWLEK